MIRKISTALAVSLMAMAGTAQANLTNGGFESGLSGWSTTGAASATGTNVNAGSGAALVTNATNNNLGTFTGTSIPGTGGGGISQSFSFTGASTLSFKWDFQTGEETSPGNFFNDAAYVVIDGIASLLANTTSALFAGAAGNGFTEKTGYQTFSTALGSGSHTLAFVVTDVGDSIVDSGLYLDAISVNPVPNAETNNVPEPGSLALLGLGLAGLAVVRQRKTS